MKNVLHFLCFGILGMVTAGSLTAKAAGRSSTDKVITQHPGENEINKSPTLAQIKDVGLCPSRDQQMFMLRGISAGEEWQRTWLTVASDNDGIFKYLEVQKLSNGDGYLKFKGNEGRYGTATVTVTVKDDGGTFKGGIDRFSRSFQVTIYAPPTLKAEAQLTDEVAASSIKGGTAQTVTTFQLKATSTTPGASFYWEPSEGLNNADIPNPVLTAANKAERTFVVTATNQYGCKSFAPLKISPLESAGNISLTASPNPVSGPTSVRFTLKGRDQSVSLSVYGSSGTRVANLFTGKAKGGQIYNFALDGSALASGVYYIRLMTASESKNLKLMVVH